jgi:hypothetical protein
VNSSLWRLLEVAENVVALESVHLIEHVIHLIGMEIRYAVLVVAEQPRRHDLWFLRVLIVLTIDSRELWQVFLCALFVFGVGVHYIHHHWRFRRRSLIKHR